MGPPPLNKILFLAPLWSVFSNAVCVLECVTDFQVLQVNRLFAITYSVDYAFSRIVDYRFQTFL